MSEQDSRAPGEGLTLADRSLLRLPYGVVARKVGCVSAHARDAELCDAVGLNKVRRELRSLPETAA